jgi:hypothetical protein
MPSLQELVNQAQTDSNKLSDTWHDIQDVINTYPNFSPDERRRLLNVIRQSLEGLHSGSPSINVAEPSINVAELEVQVRRHPDLGNEPYQPGKGIILPH